MQLGTFSISLTVKDLQASKTFYERFGFTVFAGEASENWLILKNGEHTIGLFQGMFEKKHFDLQSGLGQQRRQAGRFYRRARSSAPVESARRATSNGG